MALFAVTTWHRRWRRQLTHTHTHTDDARHLSRSSRRRFIIVFDELQHQLRMRNAMLSHKWWSWSINVSDCVTHAPTHSQTSDAQTQFDCLCDWIRKREKKTVESSCSVLRFWWFARGHRPTSIHQNRLTYWLILTYFSSIFFFSLFFCLVFVSIQLRTHTNDKCQCRCANNQIEMKLNARRTSFCHGIQRCNLIGFLCENKCFFIFNKITCFFLCFSSGFLTSFALSLFLTETHSCLSHFLLLFSFNFAYCFGRQSKFILSQMIVYLCIQFFFSCRVLSHAKQSITNRIIFFGFSFVCATAHRIESPKHNKFNKKRKINEWTFVLCECDEFRMRGIFSMRKKKNERKKWFWL